MIAMRAGPLSMVSARRLGSHKLERAGFESCKRGGDRWELRKIHPDVGRLEFPEGAHADAADYHPVHAFTGKRQKRLAHAVAVVEIAIRDDPGVSVLCIENHKERR